MLKLCKLLIFQDIFSMCLVKNMFKLASRDMINIIED